MRIFVQVKVDLRHTSGLTTVQSAEHSPILVEYHRHGEIATTRDRGSYHLELGRPFRVDGKQGDGVRAGLQTSVSTHKETRNR